MTSEMQREALAVLAEILSLSLDVRLSQLFAHLWFLGEAHLDRGLGHIEDDELLAVLYRHRSELIERSEATLGSKRPRGGAGLSVSGSPTLMESAPVL